MFEKNLNASMIIFRMLDPDLNQQHEQIKKAYADVLYKWNLLNKRTEVLKHTDNTGAHRVAIGDYTFSCHFYFHRPLGKF